MIAQFPRRPDSPFRFPCVCLALSVCVSTVPQQGEVLITTEFGKMMVEPNEICVIQVSPGLFWPHACFCVAPETELTIQSKTAP